MKFIYSNWKSILLSAAVAFGMGSFSPPAQAHIVSKRVTVISTRSTPHQIRSAQQQLKDAGYYTGTVDGRMGPMTRIAIRKFQTDNNLTVSGILDTGTRTKLFAMRRTTGEAARTAPGGMTMSPSSSTISAAQHALQDKGFFKGNPDGQMSSETQSAIREYQKSSNLNVTGQLDSATLSSLGVSK